jgi:hypothetical protein
MMTLELLGRSAMERREMPSAVLCRCLQVAALVAEAGFGRRKASVLGWSWLGLGEVEWVAKHDRFETEYRKLKCFFRGALIKVGQYLSLYLR